MISEKKQLRKRLREYDQSRSKMAMASDSQALIERHAAQRILMASKDSDQPVDPQTYQAIQTGLEGQSKEIQAAIDSLSVRQPLRMAVNSDVSEEPIDLTNSFSNLRLVGSEEGDSQPSDIFRSLARQEVDHE